MLLYVYLRWNSEWLQHLFCMGTFNICSDLPPISRYQMKDKRQWYPNDGKEMRWVPGFLQLLILREFPEGSAGRETSVRTPWVPSGKETKPRDQGEKVHYQRDETSCNGKSWDPQMEVPKDSPEHSSVQAWVHNLGLGKKHPWRLEVIVPDARAVHMLNRLKISWFTESRGEYTEGSCLWWHCSGPA